MRELLDAKKVSAQELAKAHLERIHRLDPTVRAFLKVCDEIALKQAGAAQERIMQGETNPLLGIPFALKDNMVTQGIETTCASKILEGWKPPYDSTVALKLAQHGAVLLGKTNLDEFAMGSSTEFSGFFPTRNPWDLSRVPGGSSGGSAAAVAAGMAPIAFGSDTGGSVRQPAALCGVVGMKPTYGRVSRFGLIAFSSSLDQIGPFARNVRDAIWAYEASAGVDPNDSTMQDAPYDSQIAHRPAKAPKIGVPEQVMNEKIQPEVRALMQNAIKSLSDAGAVIEQVSLPMIEHGVSTYYIIAPAEASSNLARYDGVRYGLRIEAESASEMMRRVREAGFGKEVKERIIIGTYVLSSGYYDAFYTKAHKARTLMKTQFREMFSRYDALLLPTSPTTAFKIGEFAGDPMALKIADYCTIHANLGGFPAISINAGYSGGLPVGLQLVCDSFCEQTLFSIALLAESVLGAPKMPELVT